MDSEIMLLDQDDITELDLLAANLAGSSSSGVEIMDISTESLEKMETSIDNTSTILEDKKEETIKERKEASTASTLNGGNGHGGEVVELVTQMVSKVEKHVKRAKGRHYHCLNAQCDGSSTILSPANVTDLYYYGYPKDATKKWICEVCKKRVLEYKEEIDKCLEEGKPVVGVPTPFQTPENVIIDDIDVEEGEECSDEASSEHGDGEDADDNKIYIVPANFEEIVAEQIKAMNLEQQKELCKKYLLMEIDNYEKSIATMTEEVKVMENVLEDARAKFNKITTPEYNITYVQPLDIDGRGVAKTLPAESSSSSRGDFEFKKPLPLSRGPSTSRNAYVQTLGVPKQKQGPSLQLARAPLIIPRSCPKIGDKVYAMKFSSLNYWLPALVIDSRTNIFNELELKVEFKTTKKGRPVLDPKMNPKDIQTSVKLLSAKHVAFNLPCPFVLPVGSRVIAPFIEENRTAAQGSGDYYAGIIAEPPRATNLYRYLIFFDDGYAQYVGQRDVLLVCASSKEAWIDVHPDSQEFIKSYLASYPEKAMLRLQKGSVVSLEWNGRWFLSRVLEVDASLAKMKFEIDHRTEWIYRGSERLYPIFSKKKRSENSSSVVPSRNKPGTIPIDYPEADIVSNLNKNEHVARKSTGLPPQAKKSQGSLKDGGNFNFRTTNTMNLPNVRPASVSTFSSLAEYEGRLDKIMIPADRPKPAAFVVHDCGPTCVKPFIPLGEEVRKVNPLLQPLWYGWRREIGRGKKYVHYRAPCGLRLRDYDELQEFLSKTNYNMGIEYFCFDLNVEVDQEFVPARKMFVIKDLSYGKEHVPISCLNSIDHDYPDFVSYTSHRLPGKDVKLNLDDNFLTCCDCTDDCLDKDKCSCWQLTIEGTNLLGSEYNLEVGYQHRRLHDHVVSGIYECNQRCKCKSTCSNRVVQNPMKWQLQVFKTSTKGWAIRPLNDIPTGSFICVYVGQLLSEHSANEDGKNFGDEYLAELDYIEVIERFKEGYEEDVIEPDECDEPPEPQPGPSRGLSNRDSDHQMDVGSRSLSKRKSREDDDYSDEEALLSTHLPSRFAPKFNPTQQQIKRKRKPTRDLFGENEECYIMDAKSIGNIGRYLNHSCEPNVFVQNVLVDTHDIRFPWVCFFAYKHISAGTELTWDYNYDIGSVPGKTMYCYCASQECRGRLL